MQEPNLLVIVILVLSSSLMLLAALYLLAKFSTLFRNSIRNELLRRNLVVWLIATCLILALTPTNQDFYKMLSSMKLVHYFLLQLGCVALEALFVFNVTWIVIRYLERSDASFRKKMIITLLTIIGCTMLMSIPINYITSGHAFKHLQFRVVFNFYQGAMAGLVYVMMVYINAERNRKLNEKELELSKLQALKTKAELDALHSKINPHFLYNALNSIADLSVTDGKKARKMTIALADLFRYSINYSNNNFTTIKEELEMTEVYLQIEKIRFEDQLQYHISTDESIQHYLVPRFVLQPVVENAVKHGLKATGTMTDIFIEVIKGENSFTINVADNGPAFPDDLIPGYGVKSVFDKLELLFPGQYAILFTNEPRKQVTIVFNKLIKNEPAV